MYYQLLEVIPDWAVYFIFPMGAWILLALLTYVFRKAAHYLRIDDHDSDVVDTATQNAMSGTYAMLAFSLVLVVGTSDNLEQNTVKESTQIESLGRLLKLEGSPEAALALKKLKIYADSLVHDEWPLLEKGLGSEKSKAHLQDVLNSLDDLNPQTPRQTAIFVEITRKVDQIADSREIRVTNSQSSLPKLYWIVSYLSLLGVIIITALRMLNASIVRTVAIGTQVAMISLLFSAVMIIDNPFVGETKLTAGHIARAIHDLRGRDE